MSLRTLSRADDAAHDVAQLRLDGDATIAESDCKAPAAPPEPGCPDCPEGINDHGDFTRQETENGDSRWLCAFCGHVWGEQDEH